MTWYSIVHGPEFWLAVAVWGIGAMCGIAASWAAIEISERREERHESAAFDLDHTGDGGRGTAPRGADPGERGGRR